MPSTQRRFDRIDALVRSGRYQNAGEVLREGLRMIERRESLEAAKLEALRTAARTGAAAFDRGAFTEFADVAALVAHLDELADRVVSGSGSN
ncbi:type II toxin-antitoxin system ParD family antitoxin [Methylosinus sp. Sm6]|uniref:ribbon-helix-helix domain-containing protein n=1 Tax=Methylosinus sp. Sm6 TaxID=2866948 RepID=UPI001C99BBF8|nr:type II toxin-antitoxin system ParD family antitoxin [Methylosinus sp. Sm6]MBY6242487.1 type II toxin-antitoxin system ParD family antitoxin [Methylosinus sp. Sm6]